MTGALPSLEAEAQFLPAHGENPQVRQGGEQVCQFRQLFPGAQDDELRAALRQGPDGPGSVQPCEVGEDHAGLGGQGGVRLFAFQEGMGKGLQGSGLLERDEKLLPAAYTVEPQMTMIHRRSPPFGWGSGTGMRGTGRPAGILLILL